ncbi:hypothetical protein FE784_31265 [Paenibacillus hemerocallicola]|uniref:Helicase XPB/Ssl2 N-terminal domain-containing protein n=1 Tax=Paenibacillus hemerocallicola TaxID=1172614 RepID=A0A5C4SZP6_9BACL|nr:helicase-associated domain-containing protein [Paenibacillus hemerocallicola]TNJ62272.1 hypothetical protein FE784_31265 [Paenibacillus hemerocallicola]
MDRVIRTVNQSKLKTTPSGGMPTKASAIRIEEVFLHREPLPSWHRSMHDIRTVEETSLVYGTVQLMLAAKLLDNVGGYLVVGEGAETFMQLRLSGKCRLLLNAYVKSDRIDELSRNPEMKVRVESNIPLVNCRETVLRYLAECPAEQWIQTAELLRYMKKTAYFFLEHVVGEIEVYDEYERLYYPGHEWEQVEGRLIETVLFEYLAPIGIVDVILSHVENLFDTEFLSVLYFRITPLGAGLLGIREMTEPELAEPPASSGLTVGSDFSVILTDSCLFAVHKLFFDRFAACIAEGAVTVYSLTFPDMVKALNEGIGIRVIIDYLFEHAEQDLPYNVLDTLLDWEKQIGKIRIRQATIVETDDEALLRELLDCKPIRKHMRKASPFAFEIKPSSAAALKREIEKHNRFCELEP